MSLSFKDRVRQAVTTGGTGAVVLGAADSGYQALGAGDDGLNFPYVLVDGLAWETGNGVYTHSGTSFARTREASSTGSSLNITTAAKFAVDMTAGSLVAYLADFLSSFDTKPEVAYASTSALPANTYSNGTSGVGATLTGTANGPLLIDGVTLVTGAVGLRFLIGGEATSANNGWFTLTQLGVVAVSPYILTRDTITDQAAEIKPGYLTAVKSPSGLTAGSANDSKVFISICNQPFTVGTTALTFSAVGGAYTADGTTLQLSGFQFSQKDAGTTNAKLANMANGTFKGRQTAGTGDPEDLTYNQQRILLNKRQTLTSGTTVTPDCDSGLNMRLVLAHNMTLANPTNLVDGDVINLRIKQDGTGSRLLSAVGSKWKFPSGTLPVLSTAASSVDLISGSYDSTDDTIAAVCSKAFS